MQYDDAITKAIFLKELFEPYCEAIQICGSVRREKPEVKDIEIVVLPKWEDNQNLLYEFATSLDAEIPLRWIKPGEIFDNIAEPWPIKSLGKYWRGLWSGDGTYSIDSPENIRVDFFVAEPTNWGWVVLCKTGNAAYTTAFMARAKQLKKRCVRMHLSVEGEEGIPYPIYTEQEAYDYLNVNYIEPSERTGAGAFYKSVKRK